VMRNESLGYWCGFSYTLPDLRSPLPINREGMGVGTVWSKKKRATFQPLVLPMYIFYFLTYQLVNLSTC